jgi:hypothetical protein
LRRIRKAIRASVAPAGNYAQRARHTGRIPNSPRSSFELLNAFDWQVDHGTGVAPLRVVHAINQEADVVGAGAVDRVLSVAPVALGNDPAGEVRQVGKIPAVGGISTISALVVTSPRAPLSVFSTEGARP